MRKLENDFGEARPALGVALKAAERDGGKEGLGPRGHGRLPTLLDDQFADSV